MKHIIVSMPFALVCLLLIACGSSAPAAETQPVMPTPPPDEPAPEPEPSAEPEVDGRRLYQGEPAPASTCDHGVWIPDVQEPADYVACTSNDECVMTSFAGCCSTTWVALRADRVCVSDMGSACDRECGDEYAVFPSDADTRGAACVEGRCQLVTTR